MKIGLCLLVWNEFYGIKEIVPKLPVDVFDDIFVLDGGSKDGSLEYLKDAGIRVVDQKRPGLNAAYIEAFEATDVDFLIFFHPKGTVAPTYLIECIELGKQGYDLVIASRNIKGARNEEDEKFFKPRKLFVNTIAFISALIWRKEGKVVWDVLHGFRGMRVPAFWAITPLRMGVSMDLEMVIRSYKLRYSCIEFPIIENRRANGSTHFKALPTGWKLLKYMTFEFFRKG